MAEKRKRHREKRRGEVAFVLLLAAALGLLLFFSDGMNEARIGGLLSQTIHRDDNGYLSDYDALIGWSAQPEKTEPDADSPELSARATDSVVYADAAAPAKPSQPLPAQ